MRDSSGDTIEALHHVAVNLQTKKTVKAVCRQTIDVATDILEFDQCSVLLRENEWLVPYGTSEDASPNGSRKMRVDQGLAGETYQNGRSRVVEDIQPEDDTDPAKESYRSGISVPIGEYGVFQAVSTTTAAFNEEDVKLAELLLSHTISAFNRIERERELQQQIEHLDKFASVVSHDLRNPLNTAQGYLSLAREERDSESLQKVASAHSRIDQLITDLLIFAKAGTEAIEPEMLEISQLVDECWTRLNQKNATLCVKTDQKIQADRRYFRQLLTNLLSNAVKHGGANVSITVGNIANGFYIEDDGPGIDTGEQANVFEAGYSSSDDGTGFGLNIARQVAETHEWDIQLTDGNDGGARFEITGIESVE